jgi:hypothetical protein
MGFVLCATRDCAALTGKKEIPSRDGILPQPFPIKTSKHQKVFWGAAKQRM